MKIEILIPDISKLSTNKKFDQDGLVSTIQFDAKVHPASIARLLNMQRQGVPLIVSISSPQASMDLNIQEEHPNAEGEEGKTQVDVFRLG
mgnify:CR=1 FL=1